MPVAVVGAVAVARRADVPSLGIDVERVGRLSEARWPFVFTAAEIKSLECTAEPLRADAAAAFFSAKEAYYKCRYQVTREPLGFHDVEIAIVGQTFEVRPGAPAAEGLRVHVPATGKFAVDGTWVYVAVTMSAAD